MTRAIWDVDTAALPWWRVALIVPLRVCHAVIRDLADGQLTMRAMSLVYTTLLSMVPLLAISFSVLKAFGVHNQVEPLLLNVLEPLGEKGVEIASRIIGFVENVEVGVLGAVGLGLLFYTVVSLMQKIERAFNYTWRVTHTRPFGQRFSGYLSVIVVGPVLVFASLGVTAGLMSTTVIEGIASIQPFGTILEFIGRLVPYLMVVGAFTFIYVFMPNTKVRLRSAFVGALVAGILWESAGWAFASFVVNSAKYTAIYSAFATLIIFLIWLYLSWLILLVGANVAFYDQHPEYLTVQGGELRLSNRVREKLALLAAFLIGRSHYEGTAPWTAVRLAQRLKVPRGALESVLQPLVRARLLARTGDDPPVYLPARPLETTAVKEVLDAVRAGDEDDRLDPRRLPSEAAVEAVLARLEGAAAEALAGRSLRDLALAGEEVGELPEEPAAGPAQARARKEPAAGPASGAAA